MYGLNWLAWFLSLLSGFLLFLTEMIDFGENADTAFHLCEASVGLALVVVFVLSAYNFVLSPPNRIFITYEKFLRLSLEEYFKELNSIS